MRAKLLEYHKIRTIDNGGLINRRNLLIGSGVCAALVIGDPLFGKNDAYAQYQGQLINAALRAIDLAVQIWKILQHTEGTITIVNERNVYVEGNVVFVVVGPRGVEDMAYFPYKLPARYLHLYEFYDGPYGTFPGQKNFCGRTNTGQAAIPMYVEA